MSRDHDIPAPAGHVLVRLEPAGHTVEVPAGTLLEEAISRAGVRLGLPCGGQGRCGRCVVQVREGSVRRRSTIRLAQEEVEQGYALACQTLVNSDVTVWVPPQQERLERVAGGDRADKAGAEVVLCDHHAPPWVSRFQITVDPPSMDDNTPDLERLQRELARQHGLRQVSPSLTALARLPQALRDADWAVTAEVERRGRAPADADGRPGDYRLLSVLPGQVSQPSLGVAIDIGTTTVVAYLGELGTGKLIDSESAFNEQIACGEDVISRIIYARQPERRQELQDRVVSTINALLDDVLRSHHL
jgi:uncharacterized 2Fe-2S/4Fe-4S cluster protein (DUF4445 family)